MSEPTTGTLENSWDPIVEGTKLEEVARIRLKMKYAQDIFTTIYTIAAELRLEEPLKRNEDLPLHIWKSLNSRARGILEQKSHFYGIIHYLFGDLYPDGLFDPRRIPGKLQTLPGGGSYNKTRAWSELQYKQFLSTNMGPLANHKSELRKKMGLSLESARIESVVAQTQAEMKPTVSQVIAALEEDEETANNAVKLMTNAIGLSFGTPIIRNITKLLQIMFVQNREELTQVMTQQLKQIDQTAAHRHAELVNLIKALQGNKNDPTPQPQIAPVESVPLTRQQIMMLFKTMLSEIINSSDEWNQFVKEEDEVLDALLYAVYGGGAEFEVLRAALNNALKSYRTQSDQ